MGLARLKKVPSAPGLSARRNDAPSIRAQRSFFQARPVGAECHAFCRPAAPEECPTAPGASRSAQRCCQRPLRSGYSSGRDWSALLSRLRGSRSSEKSSLCSRIVCASERRSVNPYATVIFSGETRRRFCHALLALLAAENSFLSGNVPRRCATLPTFPAMQSFPAAARLGADGFRSDFFREDLVVLHKKQGGPVCQQQLLQLQAGLQVDEVQRLIPDV